MSEWYVVCDSTGNSVSIGTVVADPLPEGLSAIALSAEDSAAILSGAAAWDSATRTVRAIPMPVPSSVTARQIRLYLVRHGIPLSAVDAAIDAISEQQSREECRVEWDYAPYVERSHPMLVPLAAALGLTEAQVDEAFREASTI